MRDPLLDGPQRAALGEALPSWEIGDTALTRTVAAASFAEAISWVVAIADEAATLDHHPDIDIRWRTLHLALTTHDSGGITRRDVDLATRIDAIVGS